MFSFRWLTTSGAKLVHITVAKVSTLAQSSVMMIGLAGITSDVLALRVS